jgi:hypothetical protein
MGVVSIIPKAKSGVTDPGIDWYAKAAEPVPLVNKRENIAMQFRMAPQNQPIRAVLMKGRWTLFWRLTSSRFLEQGWSQPDWTQPG